jgi:hypothetical protein
MVLQLVKLISLLIIRPLISRPSPIVPFYRSPLLHVYTEEGMVRSGGFHLGFLALGASGSFILEQSGRPYLSCRRGAIVSQPPLTSLLQSGA